MQYTDKETGITLRVFSSMYLDWGIEFTGPRGDTLYYNPCGLSNESYGYNDVDEDGNELDERIAWTAEEWEECLSSEFDELYDAYCYNDSFDELVLYWVCRDCFGIVNDESTDCLERDIEVREAFSACEDGGHLVPCAPYPHEQDEANIIEFSNSSCDVCGSGLAGSRYRMAFIPK